MGQSPFAFPGRQLVSQQDLAMVASPDVPRSRFTGRWTRKTTFDAGLIVPLMIDFVLPGDHLKYKCTIFARMATPLFPIFDQQRVDTHWFFIPNRLLWTNFERFMGAQDNPGDSIAYTVPQASTAYTAAGPGTLWDYMALPLYSVVGSGFQVSALPFRAYNLVYNTWFRDENLCTSQPVDTGDGTAGVDHTNFALSRRAKSHDFFTKALPWPQKFTAPTIPLGTSAPVYGLGLSSSTPTGPGTMYDAQHPSATASWGTWQDSSQGQIGHRTDIPPYADLSAAAGVTINTLRQAYLVQQLLERDARGGTRYIELVRSHFKVTPPDFRVQRPEYIGGGSTPLNVTPVAQTAPSTSAVVGVLGAAGVATGQHQAEYAATEHGIILCLASVKSELSYSQGVWRPWSAITRYDFPWPSLMGLGEQAIYKKELVASNNSHDAEVFGYVERWQEYRERYSEITGMFRPDVTGSLNPWHLSQTLGANPVLSQTFVEDSPPMARVLAAGSLAATQQYLVDALFERDAVRPVTMYGTPALLGRF